MSKTKETRDGYKRFAEVTTRLKDNDERGHIHNAVFMSWIDTAVTNQFRVHLPEFPLGSLIAVAVETRVVYNCSISHPAEVETGFRVNRIGNSSVNCGVGIFLRGADEAAAWGHMIHVWVDRESNKPVAIPAPVREGLARLIEE